MGILLPASQLQPLLRILHPLSPRHPHREPILPELSVSDLLFQHAIYTLDFCVTVDVPHQSLLQRQLPQAAQIMVHHWVVVYQKQEALLSLH
ncbi:unnamed protein product [Protopolystoma xenopodis]|uniref:Uncharacterized protein n=1 Tax=Protopolystoma xenopodis TaxID=117903 RepID=A0A448XQU9_9PLAT|nr:unnamed protein product [Protopolystoma xenopodis]